MYIRELRVRNYKLLRDFRLSFVDEATGEPRRWTVLVGRNACGKTSVLRAIALAAAGHTIANNLTSDSVEGLWDRRKDPTVDKGPAHDVVVEAAFELPELRARPLGRQRTPPPRLLPGVFDDADASHDLRALATRLHLRSDSPLGRSSVLTGTSWYGDLDMTTVPLGNPLERAREFGLPWWFVVAYGVHRQLEVKGERKAARHHQERLAPLFAPANPMGLRFANDNEFSIAQEFLRLHKAVLAAHPDLVPLVEDLELRGHGGIRSASTLADEEKYTFNGLKLPASWMSDGYQSTLAWLADLVGHFLIDIRRGPNTDDMKDLKSPKTLSGLVLIDELDLFLHPDWQLTFIEALSEAFPNLQFVATTHSPLLLSRLRPDQVVLLEADDEGSVVPRPLQRDPRLMSSTDLYEEVFGIEDSPPSELALKRNRYTFLSQDPERTDAEEAQVQALRLELEAARVAGLPEPRPRT